MENTTDGQQPTPSNNYSQNSANPEYFSPAYSAPTAVPNPPSQIPAAASANPNAQYGAVPMAYQNGQMNPALVANNWPVSVPKNYRSSAILILLYVVIVLTWVIGSYFLGMAMAGPYRRHDAGGDILFAFIMTGLTYFAPMLILVGFLRDVRDTRNLTLMLVMQMCQQQNSDTK